MASIRPSVTDFKAWMTKEHPAGHPSFTPKTYRVTVSAPGCNYGATNPKYAHQLKTSKELDERHLVPLFNRYMTIHPFIVDVKNPAMNLVKKFTYYQKAWNWILKEERKEPEMINKPWRNVKADTKMRGNAHLSSSWIRGARQPNENTIVLKLGKKEYNYGIQDFNKIMSTRSLGATVSQLRRMPAGSVVNGLKKLY